MVLKIRDFSKIGAIMEESVTDEITDFRSLTYSLSDEEAAKQHAVAEAMRRAIGRANAALEQKGQKVGALRFANLDVKQLISVAQFPFQAQGMAVIETTNTSVGRSRGTPAPPPPTPRPEKITVSASVQCWFQIL
jgi:uncharacterized protein YggE